MVVREIKVIKKFRDDPVIDHPINFAGLHNLHLELLENKLKLKQGVPVNPVVVNKRPKPIEPKPSEPPVRKKQSKSSESTKPPRNDRNDRDDHSDSSGKSHKRNEKNDSAPKKSIRPESRQNDRVHRKKPKATVDDEMIDALRDDGDEEEFIDEPEEEFDGEEEEFGESDEPMEEEEEEEEDELAHMTPEERAEYDHKEYEWRFRILKKKYKNASIPNYNQHSDLNMMKRDYERIVRELQLDDSVETYKQYLFGGFMAIELVCTQFVGIDLGGFTALQSRMMPKYERMLIELGEKSYTTWGSSLPVEIRLIGFVLLQAGIFFLAKVIADKFGETAGDLFKGFMGQPPDTSKAKSKSEGSSGDDESHHRKKKKKKMRGPRINVSDIRDMKKE